MKNQNKISKDGFTLLELVLVMAVVVVVFGISFQSLMQSQSMQIFNTNFIRLFSLVNNARSQAISGMGQLDYSDYDSDYLTNLSSPPDYVTPANYGVYFDTTSGAVNLTLFADINPPRTGATVGTKGHYDPGTNYRQGHDLILNTLQLPTMNKLTIVDGDGATPGTSAIFYSPNYADISYQNMGTTASPFVYIRLTQTQSGLCKQIAIHKLAGIPEIGPCT